MSIAAGKYLIMSSDGVERVYVFSASVNHMDVVAGVMGAPIAAGFVRVRVEMIDHPEPLHIQQVPKIRVDCFGRSETLNVESRGKEDEVLVAMTLGCL